MSIFGLYRSLYHTIFNDNLSIFILIFVCRSFQQEKEPYIMLYKQIRILLFLGICNLDGGLVLPVTKMGVTPNKVTGNETPT